MTAPTSGYIEVSPDPDKPRDDESRPVDEAAPAEGNKPKRQLPPVSLLIGAGLGALLLIAAIASAVFFYLRYDEKNQILDANESARQAACAYGTVLGNYDYQNLDKYFAGVLDGAAGDFKKDFNDTSKDFKDVLTQGQVKTSTNDVQCAIKSGDKDHAEAIVVVGQTITSLGTQNQPQPTQISMVMSMDNVDGRWLTDKLSSPLLKPQ
ncbi:hypothetical protein [Antrihabitans cavernicola]|uniref:Mce-associated membrane protein n=1 Tax=Antrihabitans cavernicola TaxID=2495913 RepID=A0A5A7S5G2_9NOCA|nr:hypothetical protein [Spelaeibacter cavernicola]KAA0019441.1 hypothetical protein FOY51_22620 [Spelaeibacter cavernicola]